MERLARQARGDGRQALLGMVALVAIYGAFRLAASTDGFLPPLPSIGPSKERSVEVPALVDRAPSPAARPAVRTSLPPERFTDVVPAAPQISVTQTAVVSSSVSGSGTTPPVVVRAAPPAPVPAEPPRIVPVAEPAPPPPAQEPAQPTMPAGLPIAPPNITPPVVRAPELPKLEPSSLPPIQLPEAKIELPALPEIELPVSPEQPS